jgi:ABC-type uncharacterized transport system permease subunit
MLTPDRLFVWAAMLLCAAVVGLATLQVLRQKPLPWAASYTLVALAFVLQTVGLYLRGLQIGACPLGNPYELIQFVLWSTLFLYLVIGPVFSLNFLGTVTSAFVSFFGILSLLVPAWDRPHDRALFGGEPLIELHAALSVFGYGIFGLLAAVSLLHWIQYNSLQRKKSSFLLSFLPSIVQLDNLVRRLLPAGLVVLTLAFATGILVWTRGDWAQLEGKLIAVFLLWLGYGALWVLRLRRRIGPQVASAAFVLLFVVALASLWPLDASRWSPEGRPVSAPLEEQQP